MANLTPATVGVDHVGLSVRNLDSRRFFFVTASDGMLSVSVPTIPPSSSPTEPDRHLVAGRVAGKRRRV